LLLVLLLLAGSPALGHAQGPGKDAKRKQAELIGKLDTLIDFPKKGDENLIDQNTTLGELLDLLGDRYDITFTANERAFKEAAGGMDFLVMEQKVLEKAFPKMIKVSLSDVLQHLLDRIPLTNNDYATFIIRKGTLEITTGQQQRLLVWRENHEVTTGDQQWLDPNQGRPPGEAHGLPIVHAVFDKRPLGEALEELATKGNYNIVQDPRAAEELKTPVTAQMVNTPLDTAVEFLADMAGLRMFQKNNVMYVTTAQNAARLDKEAKKRAQGAKPEPGRPSPPPAPERMQPVK
jgi:hypothetical protein